MPIIHATPLTFVLAGELSVRWLPSSMPHPSHLGSEHTTLCLCHIQVYYVSRGRVKIANKQFNTTNNNYELSLNEDTEVELVR